MTFSIDKPMGNIHINMDGDQPTEKEIDTTISKMEKIIKKKKGNYKNMDLLENIYDDIDDDGNKEGGILESLQEFEKELNNLNESMKEITQEGFDNNQMFDSKLYDYKKEYENIITPGSILQGSSSSSSNSGGGSSNKNKKNRPAGYIRKQNRLGLLEKWFGPIPYKTYYEKWIGKPLVQKKTSKSKSKTKCKTSFVSKYIDEGISYVRCIINIPSVLFWFIAAYIYNIFDRDSKNPAKNGDDVIIVASQMWFVFVIPLIIYITFTWYYLMFILDSNEKPIEDTFPKKVLKVVERNFFTGLFTSLVKPMVVANVFLRWTVQYLWRISATIFKVIKF
jgi:hypothetical protein